MDEAGVLPAEGIQSSEEDYQQCLLRATIVPQFPPDYGSMHDICIAWSTMRLHIFGKMEPYLGLI